jgi:threonine dehydrogenase-like Zn-dependent dehydrogenase
MAEALWIIAPGKAERRFEPDPVPAAGELRLAARFGGISRGTERLVLAGKVPPSEWTRMRAPFQSGDFPFPVKYGYATVAEVDDGRLVFCLHPHQDHFALPADAVLPLPENVPPERAVLAANMETALNILWDAAVRPADHVTIVGGGVIGALAAYLAGGIPGTVTTLVDIAPGRADLAARLGIAFALPDDAPAEQDVVIHASASAAGLATALAAAGTEAEIVEASWYGEGEVPLALGGAFHSRRLTLKSSQVGAISPARRPRWSHRRRLEAALALLADDRLDALISGETAFADLAAAYADILAAPATLCHRIRY